MKHDRVEIGKLVKLRQGFAINKNSNHHISEEITPLHLLRIGDMKDQKFSIFVKDSIPTHFIANENDIIYTRTGQVGLVFRNQKGVVHNNCFTVNTLDDSVLSQNYLYYALQEPLFYEEATSRAKGAAQPDLPHSVFCSIKLFLPPIKTQNKIASILSAFDDIIENNQKQIKLLEEAAQRLYKEWFVDFQFPGHENVNIVDGVPEGWSKSVVGELALFRRGTTITKSQITKGAVPVIAGGIDPAYFHNKANTVAPVVTVSASGANAGYTMYHNRNVFASDCSFIDASVTDRTCYIYCFLKHYNQTIRNLQKGSAQPHVYAKDLNELSIFIPDKLLLDKFVEYVNCIFDKMERLINCVERLQEARDRLLPKLMSGEIEV